MRLAIATLLVSLASLAHADSPPAPPPARPSTSSAAPTTSSATQTTSSATQTTSSATPTTSSATPTTSSAAPTTSSAAPTTSSPSKPTRAKPDEVADIEAREANLERDEPRDGLTFSAAIGPSIALGAGSVGRGPQLSLRLGHVATRRTVIMFEFGVSGSLHKQSVDGPTLTDNDFTLFVGAQTYQKKKLWIRGAGGLTTLVKNQMANGSGGDKPRTGVGGLVGAGLDIYRNGYFVFGAEATSLASVSGDGFKMHLALLLNLSYY